MSYVDPPNEGETVDDHLEFLRDPYLRRYAPSDGPRLTVSDRKEDIEYPNWKALQPMREEDPGTAAVHELRRSVLLRLRNPTKHSADDVYDRYRQLPEPRISQIPAVLRHQLLKAMGMVEKKDSASMLRYFALIADVKNSGFSLMRAEWNAAISFASRYVGVSTHTETESALSLWREMEQEAGLKGNEVTFNILFDVASKAGNFALAEMLYREMENRGFQFNRYHHVSLIHFFGLKMDADGVRAAYREMIEAGEVADVVVLNCVISSLLRCGEESAADKVYERMKAGYPESATLPSRTYSTQKAVTQVLTMFGKLGKKYPGLRENFRSMAILTPNIATYRILVNHYAVKNGDIGTVAKYLDEMRFFNIPLHGTIFLALFKAFAHHGGHADSNWSEQRLESIWKALLHALDQRAAGLYIDTWLVTWALRAFDKCTTPEMVFKAYSSLSMRWELGENDANFLIGYLHKILKDKPGHAKLLQSLGNRSYSYLLD